MCWSQMSSISGTFFVLYDFLKYFNKDVPSCLSRDKFLEIISLMFPTKSKLEKEAIMFQVFEGEIDLS